MSTAARVLVDSLASQGTQRVFCVPGESFLAVLDALYDSPIRTVVCRQEGGAAMMAEADGKLPLVGNTVDVANATWTNTIGSPELITVWTDPEFDPKVSAAYYARVLEIPTPRWTAYEARRYGIKMKKEIPMVTVERAYTSPIWYTP